MKIGQFLFCMALLWGMIASAQTEQRAKEILDRASSAMMQDSGIRATFLVEHSRAGQSADRVEGSLTLKGSRFILETPGTTTWFNGTTQWTYVDRNEEINISTPTEEELQTVNPCLLIGLYRKGFNYRLEGTVLRRGKSVYRILLTPTDSRQEIRQIELLIEQGSCQPACVRFRSAGGEETTIDILSYRIRQNLSDSSFTPNLQRYSHAEIIDLR